ncbi:MAG: SUMF1/EgtB/PvdO family nonheme iron enzyme [Alistipes sp.]|nr:SUMF1/EgtB/PvdO family nonheme iron enzyme [Alistipes sp.]
MQLQSGTYLQGDKYRIIKTLGNGGFGITYLAEHELAGRNVCIKEFFPKEYYNRDDDSRNVSLGSNGSAEIMGRFKEKFIKEAKTIARLDHPNIIHIHDVFVENNTAYYVMEYIEGESLGDVVRRCGPLAEKDAVEYIRAVASALDYIHQRRIMHLDIKPANVMLRKEDNRAILIDFGLSKQYDAEGNQTSSTPLGISAGYAPMEQYKQGGVQEFSPETDIYSLGAALYYLVTGNVPPQAAVIVDSGIPALPAHLSSGVRNAIERSMEVQRRRRPHSVKEFLALLDGDGEATILPPQQPLTPPSEDTIITPPVKEQPKVEPRKAEQPKPTPTPTTPKKRSKLWLWLLLLLIAVGGFVGYMMSGGDEPEPTNYPELTNYTDYTETAYGVDMSMVWVEGGSFDMGSNSGYDDERPVHRVTLAGYWIGATEVTQAQWESVMGTDIRQQRDKAGYSSLYGEGSNYPMYYVNYDEAKEFCRRLSERTGRTYTLPTEAQWEYAARGGRDGVRDNYTYSGSNSIGSVAWYDGNSGNSTNPVGRKSPNQLGLYDMSGNLWEWCLDYYRSYSSSSQTNPTGPSSGDSQVLRGGSWLNGGSRCRVPYRDYYNPSYRYYGLGFRVVCLP